MVDLLENDSAYKDAFEKNVNNRYRPTHQRLTLKYQDQMVLANLARQRGDMDENARQHAAIRTTDAQIERNLSEWYQAGSAFAKHWTENQKHSKKERSV